MNFWDMTSKGILILILVFIVYMAVNSSQTGADAEMDKFSFLQSITPNPELVVAHPDNSNNFSADPIIYSGGGSSRDAPVVQTVKSSSDLPFGVVVQKITDVKLTGSPDYNNVSVFWRVENGEGCCNTFFCDYNSFRAFCLEPFTLYNLYLDEQPVFMDMATYDYVCSSNKPWNYYQFVNLTPGSHKITIFQKDCEEVVDTRNIEFTMVENNGTYKIEGLKL